MKKAEYKVSMIYYSYCVLFEAGNNALDTATKNQEGSFYHILTAMLYSAFSLEAYLNYLGEIYLSNWKELERSSPKRKLSNVIEKIKLVIDFDSRPFQTFDEIFVFRNSVVHATTERLTPDPEIKEFDIENEPELPMPEWDRKITLDNGKRFIADTEEMIKKLHRKAGFQQDPFWTCWKGSWEANPLPDEN